MQFPFFNKKKNRKGLIGVDFRSSRVAIAHILHAHKSAEKPKLKLCAYEVLENGSEEEQDQALANLSQKFPTSHFYCNSSIEMSAYELLLIDAPKVESTELKQAVRWRIKDQLSYHIDDAVIDVFGIPGQQSGRTQLMYVVASQKTIIASRVKQLTQANLDIQSIDIYELTQRNIASILPEDKDGIVMLRFNEDSGLLTITRNGTLFLTRKIDFGINQLTQVLDSGLDEEDEEDEVELSIDEIDEVNFSTESVTEAHEMHNDESHQLELNEQGKLIIDEVILEIQRSLDYYISHFNQRPVAKIIFAPAPKEVPGVLEYIHDMLGIKVEVLDFNQCLGITKPLSRELQAHCFDAIGLALRYEAEQGMSG